MFNNFRSYTEYKLSYKLASRLFNSANGHSIMSKQEYMRRPDLQFYAYITGLATTAKSTTDQEMQAIAGNHMHAGVLEYIWRQGGAPYYNFWPALEKYVKKLKLTDVKSDMIKDHPPLLIRLHDETSLKWSDGGERLHSMLFVIGRLDDTVSKVIDTIPKGPLHSAFERYAAVYGEMYDERAIWCFASFKYYDTNTNTVQWAPILPVRFVLTPDMDLEALIRSKVWRAISCDDMLEAKDLFRNCVRLLLFTCLLDEKHGEELITDVEPDLSGLTDAQKREYKIDPSKFPHLMVQPNGKDIGRCMTVNPHYRSGCFALYWTGPGRKIPKIRWRKGCIVHRKQVEDVPTGYLEEDEKKKKEE